MENLSTDTIVATATPPGRGGIGVVRLSGPDSKSIACTLTRATQLKPRFAHFTQFWDKTGTCLDHGLCLYFNAPFSFTGEDVVELHGHGGPVVQDTLIKACLDLGARMARPGEFSERAFLNDKIDLTQAEAIADLIDASSKQAAKAALNALSGAFSKKIHVLNEALVELRVYVEAAIDFPEEEIDFLSDGAIDARFRHIKYMFNDLQQSVNQGVLLKEGKSIAIIGEPNVGKSTLMNLWAAEDAAIVTDMPGTTRDLIQREVSIDGIPVHLIDTAGIRVTQDVVEQKGIERSLKAIEHADMIICLMDARQKQTSQAVTDSLAKFQKPLLTIYNKIDLTQEEPGVFKDAVFLCAKRGEGFQAFLDYVKMKLGLELHQEGSFLARRRHLDALKRCEDHISRATTHLKEKAAELLAEELRLASLALCEITGEFTTEDLLGKIFSSFCIGK